ncbi:Long-chain-fatty-acid--CoA ligase [hydrothermal vent metagenome]|uniref:Long-chain-fatty-acid--CoA ligase n=1 Tax=hydrothermal vent metagenome TaxID=652676 RepID=A0A3B0RZ79_9ZZZZ
MSLHKPFGHLPCSSRVMNLGDLLTQSAQRLPEHPALIWGDKRWNWRELNRRVDNVARGLALGGVAKGDRILVQSRNCNQMFESMFACFKLGAIWVPANFRLTPEDIGKLAEHAGVVAIISQPEFCDHVTEVKKRVPALKALVSIGGELDGAVCFDSLAEDKNQTSFISASVEYDDPLWFFYTSGTTGNPKAAVLTHGQMAFVVTNHLADLLPGTTEDDRSLVVAPLSHGAGIHQLTQVARGAASILLTGGGMDPDEVWRLVEEYSVTNMFTVPSIVKILTEHQAVDVYDHSSLRYVIYAGAPMYREDQKTALAKLGPVLVQYFGLGEVTGNITVLPVNLHSVEDGGPLRVGTCGYARTGMQVAIMNEGGNILPAHETGEICVIGLAVFAGYFNNNEANKQAFRNGWFRTGDLGYLDDNGFLFITGRTSDMYISGGSNIYPREIEEKILCHPQVDEVALVGMPDAKWGEVGVAVVVRTSDSFLNETELNSWMDGKIARYKLPKHIVFRDELPKSGYGKVAKKRIREILNKSGWSLGEAGDDPTAGNL